MASTRSTNLLNQSLRLDECLSQSWVPEIPKLLLESTCDVLFHLVGDRLDWISDSIEALLGWHPEELRNQSLDQLAPPGDPAALQALVVAAATGRRAEASTRLKHRDGDWRWAHISLAPHRVPAVEAGAIGWIRDIHSQVERYQRQEASFRSLAESEARYRLLAENASDVVFQADPSGVPTWFSSSLTALTGWQPEELIGQPFEQLVHPDHRLRHRAAMAALPSEGHQQLELKVRCKDGHDTWIAVNVRQLNAADGSRIGSVGGWRDIQRDVETREILAQARRKQLESEALLRKVEEQAAIGFCLISAADGHFVKVNRAMCDMLGCDEHTFLHRTWSDFMHPEDRDQDAGLIEDINANLIPSYRLIRRFLKSNGETIWGDLSVSCIRNDDASARLYIAQAIDITEQKEASRQILKNQMLLNTILSHIDAQVYVKDRSGRYLYANREVASLIGRPAEEILGNTDAELLQADLAGMISASDQEVFSCGSSICREEVIVTASGEERIFLSHKMILPRQDEADCLLGYTTDITAHKRTEASLRESEQHFRLLAENSSDVMVLLTADGRVSWVSPALEQTLGWRPEDWIGRHGAEVLSQQGEAGHLQQHWEQICRGDAIVVRDQVLAKDGQPHWIETHASPYRNDSGQSSGSVASFRVIDDEVAAEEALRCSEERHRLLADNANDVIWTMEQDGNMSYISPAVERLRGFTAEEAMDQAIEQILTPKSALLWTNYLQRLQTVMARGEQLDNFHAELEYHRKDGKTTWCEVLAIPLIDHRANAVQLLGMSRNIQERKLHELELQQARDQAQAARLALLESNNALSAANSELRKLATTDSLTGISNRRTLESKLDAEIARSHRYGSQLTLVMFDIDHFKSINDTFGHQIGDEVLVQICQRISRQLRITDSLARWGGEEFMVLMPHCRAEKGQQVAEKLRSLIASQAIGPVPRVSGSFGVAQLLDAEDRDHLLQRLDEALYQAKAMGRNRVACAEATVNSSSH